MFLGMASAKTSHHCHCDFGGVVAPLRALRINLMADDSRHRLAIALLFVNGLVFCDYGFQLRLQNRFPFHRDQAQLFLLGPCTR